MNSPTVLVTGTSSGIGRATAQYFAANGWNVAATTRKKEDYAELEQQPLIKGFLLDVTQDRNCQRVVQEVLQMFGRLDVLVNNAGVTRMEPFEESEPAAIERQLRTNLYGPMNMTRHILPHFRKQRKGLILTVSSMGGRVGTPFYAIYSASKFAVEGFFESLWYEVYPFNIGVKLVEPGGYKTKINTNAHQDKSQPTIADYQPYVQKHLAGIRHYEDQLGDPAQVATIIFEACTDGKHQLRYVAGADAQYLTKARREKSDEELFQLLSGSVQPGSAQ